MKKTQQKPSKTKKRKDGPTKRGKKNAKSHNKKKRNKPNISDNIVSWTKKRRKGCSCMYTITYEYELEKLEEYELNVKPPTETAAFF